MGEIGWFPLYIVKIENNLSQDTIYITCRFDGRTIEEAQPNHVNSTLIFAYKSSLLAFSKLKCTFEWPKDKIAHIEAFIDYRVWVKKHCGDRHCNWKAADDGIYLYNFKQNMYNKVTNWTKID
ncbi:hypothetical protein RND81_04G094200 [Saponaria officinalis]|uniref:S-protein homolog n=1 Tax=Saponaria officinalis TaxID=3572 RepID=A0AAW1LJL7_SAPOF